ncbi:hypothetical protein ABW19_dt0207106 [Dactylella cylindrospora]|nr:hypothetical protein ABW19_dt0207106 [Dactylella cylindrospora]
MVGFWTYFALSFISWALPGRDLSSESIGSHTATIAEPTATSPNWSTYTHTPEQDLENHRPSTARPRKRRLLEKQWKIIDTINTEDGVIRCFNSQAYYKPAVSTAITTLITTHFRRSILSEISPRNCWSASQPYTDPIFGTSQIAVQLCYIDEESDNHDETYLVHDEQVGDAFKNIQDLCAGSTDGSGEFISAEGNIRARIFGVGRWIEGRSKGDPHSYDDMIPEFVWEGDGEEEEEDGWEGEDEPEEFGENGVKILFGLEEEETAQFILGRRRIGERSRRRIDIES